jgi:hypothetical protein
MVNSFNEFVYYGLVFQIGYNANLHTYFKNMNS